MRLFKYFNVPIHSFRRKLLISYLFIILIPVLSALLIFGLNSYNQTKQYHEDFMNQLNKRTNVSLQDFFSNMARNSYYYLADSRLKKVLEKRYEQSDLEYIDDANVFQQTLDQVVLMNGYLEGIMFVGLNGRVYNSKDSEIWSISSVVSSIPEDWLRHDKVVITAPYKIANNDKKVVSIVRELSDINTNSADHALAKLDIKFKAIESILGGSAESNSEVGTIVAADGKLIYNSKGNSLADEDVARILSEFHKYESQQKNMLEIPISGKKYMFSMAKNTLTGWDIVQFLPVEVIDKAFQNNMQKYALLILLSLLIATYFAVLFSKRFFLPIYRLTKTMKLVDTGTLDWSMTEENRDDEIGQLVQSYNGMIQRLKESQETERLSNLLQKKAEMNMMQAQINPHFLYNTLNVVQSIADLHEMEQISLIASSLASMYRYNIKSSDDVTIENELEQLTNYIQIQQLRFMNKFQVVYEIDPVVLQSKILKFLLQPLVENAFYHGLEPKGGKGRLTIVMKKHGNILLIKIEDDGVGIGDEELYQIKSLFEQIIRDGYTKSKVHFGLCNVYARIKNFYGKDFWLWIDSKRGEGTRVEMMIPFIKEEKACTS
ncbi:cache domain-containing sensor histidine kinase [Paenibacillus thalictri]|uniref:Sensor histidine kinase n=1 Tax=Paenibacillus thalictri TaxID=2527873 RepID=A0A4Q9DRR3_9BACL|nr:sensor histidine kinase [Paenibacillus thalictri]TBL76379.1 sensor histidine kinase [Paenibacillus thalictri]